MYKIQEYLKQKDNILKADDKYITDGNILVKKDFLKSKLLKAYKNFDNDILAYCGVPFDKGEPWELPDFVRLAPNNEFDFVLNDKYCFNYKYVCLFADLTINFWKFNLYLVYGKNDIPILKVFKNDSFVGLIMPISLDKREN